MNDIEQIKAAIAALENQRGSLGDVVVEVALGPLKEKLAFLQDPHGSQQRKQATILFMDIAGHTALTVNLDPEEQMEIIDQALVKLAAPVAAHGGHIARYQGDGFKAVFGLPRSSENDPDKAVYAALEILTLAREIAGNLEKSRGLTGFAVRIGIDTGFVFSGGQTEGEDTVKGAPVNLAARLESAAEIDTILISHHTYQHIRGVFDLHPLPPIQAKGFADPIPVYRVLAAKSRSFRSRRRGVEGVDTRLVGRELEMKFLQNSFDGVIHDREREMFTLVAEAGLGKSRLLYEFENWVDLQPQTVIFYRGRARQETQHLPYGLLRNLFTDRFHILDDDAAETVRQKFLSGIQAPFRLGPIESEWGPGEDIKGFLAGHLLGFDFQVQDRLEPAFNSPQQLRDRALLYLVDYFKAVAATDPVLIFLEDLHWADDSSLDAIARIILALSGRPVLLLAATRPDLYQRRPNWMEGQPFHNRLELRPLSRRDSQHLVEEVLQKMDGVPEDLRDLLVGNAEGNPFFVEELVKMLVEGGAIVKEEPFWHLVEGKLSASQVPATLTGVLQSRLDNLPLIEKTLLQRASVIGRVFWDQAVVYLQPPDEIDPIPSSQAENGTENGLQALRDREMIYRRDLSAFTGAQEHIFKHAILRDVTYASVLKRHRRQYHALAAEWLIQQSGGRVSEWTGLIADHLEQAGHNDEALVYLRQAGGEASARFAHEEAAGYFGRALALLPPDQMEERFTLHLNREEAWDYLGRRDNQEREVEQLAELAAQMKDPGQEGIVAYRRGLLLSNIGDYVGGIAAGRKGAALAEEAGDWETAAKCQNLVGNLFRLQGDFQEARQQSQVGLNMARRAGSLLAEGYSLNVLGLIAEKMGNFDEAFQLLNQSHQLAREAGDLRRETATLNNLGNVISNRWDYDLARTYYKRALMLARETGDRRGEMTELGNLGWMSAILGEYQEARSYLQESLAIQREIGQRQTEGITIINLALVALNLGEYEQARRDSQEALTILTRLGEKSGIAYAYLYLAHANLALRQFAAAQAAYTQALNIHHELEQVHLAVEPLAGLAKTALELGDISQAVDQVDRILNYLDGGGSLEGIEEPMRVYLTCYQVFEAARDARADRLLVEAYSHLHESAKRIPDEATRKSFLENVPVHRQLIEIRDRRAPDP